MDCESENRSDFSQEQDASERLLSEIQAGQFRPGDRLAGTEPAARLGISRAPICEALRNRDDEQAERAVRRHIQAAHRVRLRKFRRAAAA